MPSRSATRPGPGARQLQRFVRGAGILGGRPDGLDDAIARWPPRDSADLEAGPAGRTAADADGWNGRKPVQLRLGAPWKLVARYRRTGDSRAVTPCREQRIRAGTKKACAVDSWAHSTPGSDLAMTPNPRLAEQRDSNSAFMIGGPASALPRMVGPRNGVGNVDLREHRSCLPEPPTGSARRLTPN